MVAASRDDLRDDTGISDMGSDPRSDKRYFLERTKLSRFTLFWFGWYFSLVMRLKVIGLQNVPSKGGCLLVSNHLAQIDSFLLLTILPRPIAFMAKEEIFLQPASDYFCRHLGGFPVHRDRLDRWALKYALTVLDKGYVLGIYPEGERSGQKQLQEAKVGPAYLAIKSERPLIPIAITGTHFVLKKWWPLRAPVTVRFGKAIYALPEETPQALTERMMMAIASMLPPEMRGVYKGFMKG